MEQVKNLVNQQLEKNYHEMDSLAHTFREEYQTLAENIASIRMKKEKEGSEIEANDVATNLQYVLDTIHDLERSMRDTKKRISILRK